MNVADDFILRCSYQYLGIKLPTKEQFNDVLNKIIAKEDNLAAGVDNHELLESYLTKLERMPDSFHKEIREEIKDPNEYSLDLLGKFLIRKYISWRTGETEFDKKMYINTNFYQRFERWIRIVDIIVDKYHYNEDKIHKVVWSAMLDFNPDHLEEYLTEMPTILGIDIKKLIFTQPQLMNISAGKLKEKLNVLQNEFQISDHQILKCLDVLNIGTDVLR